MADFTFDTASVQREMSYPVVISEFEDQTEQRRLTSAKQLIAYTINFPAMTKTQFKAIETFYDGKLGPLVAFTYDDPVTNTEYKVRFEGPLQSEFSGGFVRASCRLVIIDQSE